MHVFARGGGKFGVLYCKYECVIQRVASLIYKLTHVTMHVNKNMHVFARGGGNFDSGGKRNVLFRGGGKVAMLVNKKMHVFARGDGNDELRGGLRHDSCMYFLIYF